MFDTRHPHPLKYMRVVNNAPLYANVKRKRFLVAEKSEIAPRIGAQTKAIKDDRPMTKAQSVVALYVDPPMRTPSVPTTTAAK